MESASSSSSSPEHHHQQFRSRLNEQVEERVFRALNHELRLLHRSESNFFILGATGNVYTVTLTTNPTCTCPDHTTPCKHILFVLIRVLGLPLDDACLRRRTLRPCQLDRLLSSPAMPEALASVRLQERFHQLYSQARQSRQSPNVEVEDGMSCPICLERMEKGERVLACGTCRNVLHEQCLMMWKRSRGRRAASCVICRARWRLNRSEHDQDYLNLSAYVGSEDGENQDEVVLCVD